MDNLTRTKTTAVSRLNEVKQHTNDKTVVLHFGSKKIRDYTTEEKEGLLPKLSKLVFLSGVSKPLTIEESKQVINFWDTQFKDISYSEVEAAIKMNSAWEFEEKVQHFQKFNNDFIGSIIHFYRIFRAKRLSLYSNKRNPALKQLETSETDKVALLLMADNKTFDELNEKFTNKKANGFSLLDSVRYFDMMKRKGKIPDYKDAKTWLEFSRQEFELAESKDKENGKLVVGGVAYKKVLKRYKKHILERFLLEVKEMGIEDLKQLTE